MPEQKKEQFTRASGSGFIISKKGHIVTNNHVVADAKEIMVELHDKRKYKAKLVGRDEKTDLALLKIEAKEDLMPLQGANSKQANVGEWVLAIGFPFQIGKTVTHGIVSGLAREIGGIYDDYIQTDAPINVGNSGGPLVNMKGEVLGVNAAILSPSGANAGVGFAISSDLAKSIIERLNKTGKVTRGSIGVRIQKDDDEVIKAMGITTGGALINTVDPNGPSDKAGMKSGDIVVSFNNIAIKDSHDLFRMIAEAKIGKDYPISVMRKENDQYKAYNLTIKIAERPENDEEVTASNDGSSSQSSKIEELGLHVAVLNNEYRSRFSISKKINGLVILDFSSLGLMRGYVQKGDVITHVGKNKSPLTSIEQLKKEIKTAQESGVILLSVNRKGHEYFFGFSIPDEYKD